MTQESVPWNVSDSHSDINATKPSLKPRNMWQGISRKGKFMALSHYQPPCGVDYQGQGHL